VTVPRPRPGWVLWLLAAVAVPVHLGLTVLALVEYAQLGWLASEPYELTAVSAVAVSGVLAVAGALRVAWPALRGGRALRHLLRSSVQPLPVRVRAITDPLHITDRVDVVATADAFAVTHGLLRPRILLSTGLVEALDAAELAAVLVHEHHHLLRRDPLRLLAARLLTGYGWYLPLLRWWTQRLALRRELAADRAATANAGVAAVAGALLKLADLPAPAAVAAVNPMGNLPDRIAQLEGQPPVRQPQRGWLLAGVTLANLAGLSAAAICCTGLGVAMAGGMS
jgi:beta-lactamase regulating signal transducer with metallopeptidase domain